MRRWLLWGAAVALALGLLVVGSLWGAYRASQHVPDFYRQAMLVEPAEQADQSKHMVRQVTALASDLQKEGPWKALFTQDQINGWLAVDLVKNHAGLLPPAISDPRVNLQPGTIFIACRYRHGRWQGVLSLSAEVYLAGPNTVAVRILKARAGSLPLPLDNLLRQLSEATQRMDYHIQWRQVDGDPVALVALQPPGKQQEPVQIQSLQVREGAIYVAGSTKAR